MTLAVLQEVEGIDNWTIYRALSELLEGLGGRSPVEAVTPIGNVLGEVLTRPEILALDAPCPAS